MSPDEHTHKKSLMSELKRNPWILTTFIFGVLAIVLILVLVLPSLSSSGKNAGKGFVDFINSRGGTQIDYISSKAYGSSLYEVTVSSNGQEIPAYITQDGKYFIQIISPIGDAKEEEPIPQEIPKTDKPVVELFVMSYCPYGTQAEKGMMPVFDLLGNKIDGKIRYVHYVLHGEKETQENYRQICIREEQGSKFNNYIKCTLDSNSTTAPSDPTQCMKNLGIDIPKVNDCMANRAQNYYEFDSDLSEKYNDLIVQESNGESGIGSPALVINGKVVESARDSASLLDNICQAFNDAPEECSTQLSSSSPSAGFGYGATGSGSTASC